MCCVIPIVDVMNGPGTCGYFGLFMWLLKVGGILNAFILCGECHRSAWLDLDGAHL
jgi:hypothetical protein